MIDTYNSKMSTLKKDEIIYDYCDRYNIYLFVFSMYYVFSTLIYSFFDFELLVIYNTFVNFCFIGLQSFVVQRFLEMPYHKQVLGFLNFYLVLNIVFNIWVFLEYYNYYIYHITTFFISMFMITQNKLLYSLYYKENKKNEEILDNVKNTLNQKMKKVRNDVKDFSPEQKKIFKEMLIKQMKQVLNLKNEIEKKTKDKED